MKLYTMYIEIFNKLTAFCNDWKREKDNLTHFQKAAIEKKAIADSSLLEELQEISKKRKLLEAYLNIAKAHTVQQTPSAKPLPYDEGKLARISVQINSSFNDAYATQLYTEATGQLKFLEEFEVASQKQVEEKKVQIDKVIQKEQADSAQRCALLKNKVVDFLKSDIYQSFIALIKKEKSAFDFSGFDKTFTENNVFDIGETALPFPTISEFENDLFSLSDNLMDRNAHSIYIPHEMNLSGCVLLAEYNNASETDLLQGLQAVLLNIARYYRDVYDQVVFIDPIRFNNSGLGCLSLLSEGKNSFINPIPSSIDEIRHSLKLIIDTINEEEHNLDKVAQRNAGHKIYVFHNFPQAYDESLVSKIRQLCVNAEYYGITIILTNNPSLRNTAGSEALEYIKVKAQYIKLTSGGENEIFRKDINSFVKFKWFKAPKSLPDDVRQHFITDRPVTNNSNNYEDHFSLSQLPKYIKGNRSLTNIPYGVDADGNILYLDFENTNFATFICGASRSGKSTLLHTIITGILKNNHPDDVEVWLIDFKMTEFSRYISHLPPHVRYIILDESPELVYDIIDRLSEILLKRQNIFKGKWDKLSDVPAEKYMPSIFVIIDEFSVMSQIIADSVTAGKDNYTIKLQTLLAKGAALGMHFIFASQGFTSGTRGLNDFSKKQVQQRIAMKTEVSEIKATLDLQSMGDDDRAKMEQLPVHHTLVKSRVPVDIRGNYLIYSKVLYISDNDVQARFIEDIKTALTPVPKYSSTDLSSYIDKKTMVVDGNRYVSFESGQADMQDYFYRSDIDEDELAIFAGEPRRMLPIFPIILGRNFQENLLVVGSINEKVAMSSLILSVVKSLKMQDVSSTIIASRKNNVYRHLQQFCDIASSRLIRDMESICEEIRTLKQKIEARVVGDEFYIILGLEAIYADMMFSANANSNKTAVGISATIKYEKRKPGEIDINTLLTKIEQGEAVEIPSSDEQAYETNTNANLSTSIYDAREDLKYILTQGPKLGYRFVLLYNSVGEFRQNKLESTLFNHRIFFRTPRIDANGIVDSNNASIIAELPDHCFRYTNGLDSLSFRPYLHMGIVIDGWQVTGNGTIDIVEEDEDYLL